MKLSVITVTYNCADLLERTLKSVREQTYASIEHILVDGGSRDGTLDLIRRYADFPGSWISEPDKGIYDAMNKGLRLASGEYVLFLNAGDTFFAADTVERVFSGGPSGEADIYYGQTKISDLEGRILGDRWLRAPAGLNWKSFRYGMLVCHQSFIVKRSLAPAYELRWKICADIDWCIRCMKAARIIHYTGLYISCFLEGGFSGQREKQAWKERFLIMRRHYGLAPTLLSHLYIVFRRFFRRP